MLVSYKWLQRFFDKPLPAPDVIADKLTFGAFEIESVEKRGDDMAIDVKVLPDRACYALSHRGVAREVATLCELAMKDPLRRTAPVLEPRTDRINVTIYGNENRCSFYAAALLKGVKVGPSPAWLKEHLETIGQKSINNIVDATNFVMFDLGTPLHAFDADKLSGAIGVRAAEDGETIALLGGQEKTLTKEVTVITDAKADVPIAIAGVKGGARAELSLGTTNIIIEAAKFDPVRTRKTATALGLKTDASKRFENSIAVELPAYGMRVAVDLILEIAGGELAGFAATELPHKLPYTLGVSSDEVNRLLGTALSDGDVSSIVGRLGFDFERVENPAARVVEVARAQIGKPYTFGASVLREAPRTFDCSGLALYSHLMAGVFMPRVSIDQYLWGDPIEKDGLEAGDLIFFNTAQDGAEVRTEAVEYMKGKKVPAGISHVAIYAGSGMCVHAREKSGMVLEEKLDDVTARAVVIGYRRVVTKTPRFAITVPFERLDLRIPQDLIEEIGRVYGYENITAKELPPTIAPPEPNVRWATAERVRKALSELGFTEVYTYTLRSDGEVKLANALASDKSAVRGALAPGVGEALDKNEYNAPLLGLDTVKIFEIGNIFTTEGEKFHACIGVRPLAMKNRAERAIAMLLEAKTAIENELGAPLGARSGEETLEFDLGTITRMNDIVSRSLPRIAGGLQYKPLSVYPFVLRDISLWVPDTDEARGTVLRMLGESDAGLLQHVILFDQYKKDGRNSLAFHLVFQSHEKTLSDAEVNAIMDTIQSSIKNQGWEVR